MNQRIFLVGPMGAGKSTIGRVLARRLDLEFVDSDRVIESRCGVRIPMIFELEGEEGFRTREAQAIDALTQLPRIVLATGGGAVLRAESRAHLRDRGFVVYLHASPSVLWNRTRGDRNRPLLQTSDPRARIEVLYEQRDPLYRETAHAIVETGKPSPTTVAEQIAALVRARST